MQLPKLAVFDMDGLLFDTERVLMEEKRSPRPPVCGRSSA